MNRISGCGVDNQRQPHDRASAAKRAEFEQSRRLDTDDRKIRNTILERFEQSDSGRAFNAAMQAQGFELTNGDRRNCFVVIDQAGGYHALNKALTGKTLAEIEARLADLDRSTLRNATEVSREREQRQPAREAQEGQQYAGAADTRGKGNARTGGPENEPQGHSKPRNGRPQPTRTEIRTASAAQDGIAFVAALRERGIIIAEIRAADLDRSARRELEGLQAAKESGVWMMATGGADAFTSEQQASARHSFENWQQERQEEEKPASSFESYVDFVQEKQAERFWHRVAPIRSRIPRMKLRFRTHPRRIWVKIQHLVGDRPG